MPKSLANELMERRAALIAEATEIAKNGVAANRDLTVEEQATFDQKINDAEALQKRAKEIREGERAPHELADSFREVTGVDPRYALDRRVRDGSMSARSAELVERLTKTGSPASQSWTQRWAHAAGSEAYERAFAKLLVNPTEAHLRWTPEEHEAFQAVDALRSEQRAMSIGDLSAGGYMLPTHLDPAILLTSDGSVNPLRQMARVEQIATSTWNGISSAGVTAEWITEATEVADASPTLDDPSIPVHKADAFVPFSFEVEGDALGFMQQLGRLLADGAEQLTATGFTVGTGSDQPTGFITSLVDDGGSVVPGNGTEALDSADPYALQNALPPRFQSRAVWAANLTTINEFRQMETGNGSLKFPSLQANPPMLLGRSMNEVSNMDGAIDPGVTAANHVLAYGDFQQFVIVDRVGSILEIVPHLFGPNGRPTGQRGALLWFRTGSDVVVPEAFRLLNVPTTA